MKIAISTDNGRVSEHFGRCPLFTLVKIEAKEVRSKQTLSNPGHQPGFLPQFLKQQGVECIVAGGMGMRAKQLFAEAGIKTVLGVSGGLDEVIAQLAAGNLEGGDSLCTPGAGRGYGVPKSTCDHPDDQGGHSK
ncbi:MAG: NifB/NifX family molybdenum-iron cluster-binding protein [Candidatus Saganbacteria bacterium]|nr:NifB/NifX family molybdenum-iron cluster-binding protein [Candidatus Saganbacteria bacterium]